MRVINSYDVRKDVQNKCSFHIMKCKMFATCDHCGVFVSDGVVEGVAVMTSPRVVLWAGVCVLTLCLTPASQGVLMYDLSYRCSNAPSSDKFFRPSD